MNREGNLYTFIYASALVIVVAIALSVVSFKLQPIQYKNIEVEKKQNILSSVGISSTPADAAELYEKYITDSYLIDEKGNRLEGDAFNSDLKKELSKPEGEKRLPVFVCTQEGHSYIILPVRGKGLWGPIWGYLSLEEDFNTLHGAIFDHKGETPGLGAEIAMDWFQAPFKGKKLFDSDGVFTSIHVYKGGKGAAQVAGDTEHGVDAISGGTITSKGLEDMLNKDCLIYYKPFLEKSKK